MMENIIPIAIALGAFVYGIWQARQTRNKTETELKADSQTKASQIQGLQRDLADQHVIINDLRQQVQQLSAFKALYQTLEESHKLLKQDHEQLKQDHEALKRGHESLKAAHEQEKDERARLQKENQRLEKLNSDLFEANKALKIENNTYRQSLILVGEALAEHKATGEKAQPEEGEGAAQPEAEPSASKPAPGESANS